MRRGVAKTESVITSTAYCKRIGCAISTNSHLIYFSISISSFSAVGVAPAATDIDVSVVLVTKIAYLLKMTCT
jgi:hypothetical protein